MVAVGVLRCRKNVETLRGFIMAETLSGKTPLFGGSTGGLLKKAVEEEKYAITWSSPKQQVFEMPTGGAATMNEGENMLEIARKEYGIALGAQFRKMKITDYKIYRIYPNGETQYLHPANGVFPEKVNEGREKIRLVNRKIGDNPSAAKLKFSGVKPFDAPNP
jgi:photosystem I subunit 2